MSFYQDERERFKHSYHILVLPGLLAYYFLQTQSKVVAALTQQKKGLEGGPVHLYSIALLVCILLLAAYLHSYLFWIKEQGKRIFLIPKYDFTPLGRNVIYRAKMRIIIREFIIFAVWIIAIYVAIHAITQYYVFDPFAIFLDLLKLLATMAVTFFVFLGFELFQDYVCKKNF